jgi:hypothetical protein
LDICITSSSQSATNIMCFAAAAAAVAAALRIVACMLQTCKP